MKKIILTLSFLLVFALSVFAAACGGNGDEGEKDTVSFDVSEIVMDEWETVKIKVTSSDGSPVTLSVGDEAVLYIKGANLTGLKKGSATLTAAMKNKPSVNASITVTVNENAANRPVLTLNGKKFLGIGDKAEYTASIKDGECAATFGVTDEEVAIIDPSSGVLTAKKAGKVKITAMAEYCGVDFNAEYEVTVNPQIVFKNDASELKVNVKNAIFGGYDSGYSIVIDGKTYIADGEGCITLNGADFISKSDTSVNGVLKKGAEVHEFGLNVKFAALSGKLYNYYKDGSGNKHFDLIEKDEHGYRVDITKADPNTKLPTLVLGIESDDVETKMAEKGYNYVRLHVKFNSFIDRSATIVRPEFEDLHYTFGYWFQDKVGTGNIGWFMFDNAYVNDESRTLAYGGSVNYMVDASAAVNSYVNIYSADGTLLLNAGDGETGWTEYISPLETDTEYIIEIAAFMQYKVRLSGFDDAVITEVEWVKDRLKNSVN